MVSLPVFNLGGFEVPENVDDEASLRRVLEVTFVEGARMVDGDF